MRPRHPILALGLALITAGTVTVTSLAPRRAPGPGSGVQVQGPLSPARWTAAVPHDADDPAIWVCAQDRGRSLLLGTDKAATTGALHVFGLDGRIRQVVGPLDRPNNVDVEYGLRLGGASADIAVVTERARHRLRVYRIRADGSGLDDASGPSGVPVLDGETGPASEPMGIALYRRPRDGAVFAIVAPKTGGPTQYLWQYRLQDDGTGRVAGTLVRRFGHFSRIGAAPGDIGEIEAVAVDDELGYVYYADERFGIRKWAADPDAPDADRELAVFGRDGYLGDREGLAVLALAGGRGFIVSSDQVSGGSRLRLYRREGGPQGPHDHADCATIPTAADDTDGLDVTAAALPGFPEGLVVMMDSGSRSFTCFRWDAIERARAAIGTR